jgi:hypothetical protein
MGFEPLANDEESGADSFTETDKFEQIDFKDRKRVRRLLEEDKWWKETPAQAICRRFERWLKWMWESNAFIIIVVDIFVLIFLHIAFSAHTCEHIGKLANATLTIKQ